MGAPGPDQTAKSLESRTNQQNDQETRYWICCKCGEFNVSSEAPDEDIYDFELDRKRQCDYCDHSHCSSCENGTNKGVDGDGIISSNLGDKLRAKIENAKDNDKAMDLWRCCGCGEGPITRIDDEVAEQCPRHNCGHWQCKSCMTARGSKSTDEDGDISWNLLERPSMAATCHAGKEIVPPGDAWVWNNDECFETNFLGLDEEKLIPPEMLPRFNTTKGGYEATVSALSVARGESHCPSTPGETNASTVSSAGSPCRVAELEGSEESIAEAFLECRLESRKQDCLAKMNLAIKRSVRRNGNSAEMPLTTQRKREGYPRSLISDHLEFLIIWEHAILPFLAEFMPVWFGPGYTIGLRRGKVQSIKVISIMTDQSLTTSQRLMIGRHVLDILPETFKNTTKFDFRMGTIKKLGIDLDDICDPRNPYYYCNPTMGDSVGISISQGDDRSTSTLGPCIVVGEEPFWLVNFHPLQDAANTREEGALGLTLEHPSPDDRFMCIDSGHELFNYHLPELTLGQVAATSGMDYKTTRLSNNPYWAEIGLDYQHIVVDWALCSASSSQTNLTRIPAGVGRGPVRPITAISDLMWGASVYSTGRTSGLQHGSICLSPELISAKMNGTGRITREWFVEEPFPYDDEAGWTESGIGVSGDSGAAIVDDETNVLYGQLWGRNKYEKGDTGPRITFFTPISDIFDDIQEKFLGSARPELPSQNGHKLYDLESPACSECLREHQDRFAGAFTLPRLEAMIFPEEMTPSEEELLTPETVRSPDARRQDGGLSTYSGPQGSGSWPESPRLPYHGLLEISDGESQDVQEASSEIFLENKDQEGLGDARGKRKLPVDFPETIWRSRKRCHMTG